MMHNAIPDPLSHSLSRALTGQSDTEDWLALSDLLKRHLPPDRRACLLATCALAAAKSDLLRLTDKVLYEVRLGAPLPAFLEIASEARWWADLATNAERRAWMAACFERLAPRDQHSFLEAASRRIAA